MCQFKLLIDCNDCMSFVNNTARLTLYPGFTLSATRCQQPKHYCQFIVFPNPRWIPPIQLHSTTCFHTFSYHCDVGSRHLRLFQNGQEGSHPKESDREIGGCGHPKERERGGVWCRPMDWGSLQGCLCPQGLLRWSLHGDLIQYSRFPQGAVWNILPDRLHAAKRSEVEQIEMVHSLPSFNLCCILKNLSKVRLKKVKWMAHWPSASKVEVRWGWGF